MNFKITKQTDFLSCGPYCLKMISDYYGFSHSIETIQERIKMSDKGTSFLELSKAAKFFKMDSKAVKINFAMLITIVKSYPLIIHWDEHHFVILFKIDMIKDNQHRFYIADPARGSYKILEPDFIRYWSIEKTNNPHEANGYALLITPSEIV